MFRIIDRVFRRSRSSLTMFDRPAPVINAIERMLSTNRHEFSKQRMVLHTNSKEYVEVFMSWEEFNEWRRENPELIITRLEAVPIAIIVAYKLPPGISPARVKRYKGIHPEMEAILKKYKIKIPAEGPEPGETELEPAVLEYKGVTWAANTAYGMANKWAPMLELSEKEKEMLAIGLYKYLLDRREDWESATWRGMKAFLEHALEEAEKMITTKKKKRGKSKYEVDFFREQ